MILIFASTYEYFIDTDAGCCREELVLISHLFKSNSVSKVLAHIDHVHSDQFWLKYPEQGHSYSKNGAPALQQKHIENGRHQAVGQETGKDRHEPLWSEVVRRHLNLSQVLEEVRHVELYQLGYLEVFQMQFWYTG